MQVRRKTPEVNAVKVTWDTVKNHIEVLSQRDDDAIVYPATGEYFIDDFAPTLLEEEDFTDEGLWVLGPYPDQGYEVVTNTEFELMYEEV